MAKPFYDDEDMVRRQERLAATPDVVAQRHVMLRLLDLKKGENVLEVGSGNGILARDMLRAVGETGRVYGVDSSEPMVRAANELCPGGMFLHGDAINLPVADSRFDVLAASQVLCFVPDVSKALSEMFRVRRRGGRAVILDSDWDSLVWNSRNPIMLERIVKLLTGIYADAHVPRTLPRKLLAAGFQITGRQVFTIVNWELANETFAQHCAGFIKSMMDASEDFTTEDWEAWAADQKAIAEDGEFLFSLNRYIFTAMKV